MTAPEVPTFVTGGKVQAGQGLYVVRKADTDLLRVCLEGKFGVVLHSRQVGKSSLLAHTATSLKERGAKSAIVDLTTIGTKEFTAEQWYLAVLDSICVQLGIANDFDFVTWWDENARLTHVYRLVRFCSGPLLERVSEQIVIFVDEIDTTLELDFTDDFFAAVRDLYQTRDRIPALSRLSFVFAGSSTPDDLMRDANRTPFNIGVRVDIQDFTESECLQFAEGLHLSSAEAGPVIGRIHHWTGGHPYLTQTLCAHVLSDTEGRPPDVAAVDRAVEIHFFGPAGSQDRNLNYVREMLTVRADKIVAPGEVLRLYRDIVRGRSIKENAQSRLQTHLKLSGVVVQRDGYLQLRNRIYSKVFGRRWLREQLPFDWQTLGKISAAVLAVIMAGVAYYFLEVVPRQAAKAKRLEDTKIAVTKLKTTSDEKDARALYDMLKSREDLVRQITKPPATADDLYRGFWEKRADAIEQQGSSAKDPDDKLLLSALADIKRGRAIRDALVKEFDGRYRDSVSVVTGHRLPISTSVFARDGKQLATGAADGAVRLWTRTDVAIGEGAPLLFWRFLDTLDFQAASVLYRPDFLNFDRTTSDRNILVATSYQGLVATWNLAEKHPVPRTYSTHVRASEVRVGQVGDYAPTLALVVAGERLLVTGGAVQELAYPSMALLSSREVKPDTIWTATLSAGGGLATASQRGIVEITTADSGQRILKEETRVNSVRFSADGRWLVTATAGGAATVWDVARNVVRTRLDHKSAFVTRAVFCCEGEQTTPPCDGRAGNSLTVLTTTAATPERGSIVRLWRLSDAAETKQDPAPLEREYAGSVAAISSDCTLIGTVGGAVSTAAIEGLVIRSPWSPRSPRSPIDTLERWEVILRRKINAADGVDSLTDPAAIHDDAYSLRPPHVPPQPS